MQGSELSTIIYAAVNQMMHKRKSWLVRRYARPGINKTHVKKRLPCCEDELR